MSGKATISEQIYRVLYEDIVYQRIPCGQKLTLKVLKERFGVSHTPIREALTRLSEQGLVNYYSNCGVKVLNFTDEDIRNIYNLIAEIDSMAIRFCKEKETVKPLLIKLKIILDEGNRLLADGNISEWKDYSEHFHMAFFEYVNNPYLDRIANIVRGKVEMLSCMYYQEPNVEVINQEHIRIYEAVCEGDFDRAADMMREHLVKDTDYALAAYHAHNKSIEQAKKTEFQRN